MILIVISVVIAMIFSFYKFRRQYYLDRWPLCFLCGVIAGVGAYLITILVTILAPTTCVNPTSYPLQNLSSGQSISGNFYLGSGYFNQQSSYFYYVRDSTGAILGKEVLSNNARIFDDTPSNPTVTYYALETDPRFQWATVGLSSQGCVVDFHVPPNSVINNYQVGR